MKDIGDRMKKYESASQFRLTPRTPVIIRLDGKAFHTLTRSFEKPFDAFFMSIMVEAAREVCKEIQGFQFAYVQSDEVNILISDNTALNSQGWFDYKLSKMVSVAAGLMSTHFTTQLKTLYNTKIGIFDARAFNVPAEDVPNYFVWRIKDWLRNSLSMYARSVFSHKELIKKSQAEVHEMLHEKGLNWATDLNDISKNGTWILKDLKAHSWEVHSYREVEMIWETIKSST